MFENIVTKIWAQFKKIYIFLKLDRLLLLDKVFKNISGFILKTISYFKRMQIHPDGMWGTEMRFLLGLYEAESILICKKLIKPGMSVVDVGGDIGYYTRFFSNFVKEKGNVHVFEPDPSTFAILEKNIKAFRYKNVVSSKLALSDKNGKMDFFEMKGPGKHSLFDVSKEDKNFIVKDKITVQTTTLDDFLEKLGNPKIDFLKIDIEGGEISAMMGMKKTIANNKKIMAMVEFNTRTISASGKKPSDYIRDLSSFGFIVKEINSKGQLKDIDEKTYKIAEENYVNLLCFKELPKL